MKKTLIAVCSLLVAVGAYAQGSVNFNSRVPAAGIAAPISLSTGVPATGPQYVAILLGGATAATMAPIGTPSALRTGALAGHVSGGSVTIPGIPAGGPASVQVLAFDSTLYADAAAALAAGDGAIGTGRSAVLSLTKTGDPTALPPGTPVDLVGLTSFTILVPEPSTVALAIAGGLGLLLFRRRK